MMLRWFQQAVFRHTLEHIQLYVRLFSSLPNEMDYAWLWDCFPTALKEIDVRVSSGDDITLLDSFHRIHAIARLSLYFCMYNSYHVYQYNSNSSSNKMNRLQSSIFHPSQYPAELILLSPLQEFQYTAPSKFDKLYDMTEEMLRVFLQRFPHLERMQLTQITMNERVFKQVQQEYRYCTIITKLI